MTDPPSPADPVPALVLAGGDASDTLARTVGAPAKALVPLKGRPLGAYVLDALRASQRIGPIVWVGELDAEMRRAVDQVVPSGPRLIDSLTLGLGALTAHGTETRVLLASADVPWIDGATVDRFIHDAHDLDADIVYPVVPRDVYDPVFPELPRTWIRVGGRSLTGGNLVYARSAALRDILPWIDRATGARKSPLRLAAQLGPATVASLLTGAATIPRLEARLSRLVGRSLRALVSHDPSLACDVDEPDRLPATLSLGTARRDEAGSA